MKQGIRVGLGALVAVQGLDRSAKAKGDTETEDYPETLATVEAAVFVGYQ
jgi:hypothetical protein